MKPANTDEYWMGEALAEARKASEKNEVPIGAIAVVGDEIVGRAHNVRESTHNPLGHAELLLIEELAKRQKSWRLDEATIYVTCEPCLMCSGAMLQARIPRVVYGCGDPKAGAMGSLYDVTDECGGILSDFFKKLRAR